MIKLYFADIKELEDPKNDPWLFHGLPDWRREKCIRPGILKKRKQEFAASLLLQIAAKEAGLDQKIMECPSFSEHGKPYLNGVFFSISHSGEYALLAASDREIGADLEVIREPRMNVAEHFFAEEEKKWLEDCKKEELPFRFYQLWTLKESFLKYTGHGMSLALSDFLIRVWDEPVTVRWDALEKKVFLKTLEKSGCLISVCGEESPEKLKITEIKLANQQAL